MTQARHAARELALLTLFQLERKGTYDTADSSSLDGMILASVRSLSEQAEDSITSAMQDFASYHQYIEHMEATHPDNEDVLLEEPFQPVPLPNSKEMAEKLQTCMDACNQLLEAFRIPEFRALAETKRVFQYAKGLVTDVIESLPELDAFIQQAQTDWRPDRLSKLDRTLLRLAIAEMRRRHTHLSSENPDQPVDVAVSINEAVELAKQYGGDESAGFINGVLGEVARLLETSTTEAVAAEEEAPASVETTSHA